MKLDKEKWTKDDIKSFQEFLKQFENPEKREWSTNILNTSLPVLSIKTADMKSIIKEIAKGNYLNFLDYMIWDYYENTAINGYLICYIKDFKTLKKYLDIYSAKADNWATCDLLKFDIKDQEENYYNLALEYIDSPKPFVRRIGINILFNYVSKDEYIDKIFCILDRFENEEHYYVNMVNAWLFCECFIKQRDKTIKYLQKHKLNKFTINKGVQKCRDSYRVSKEDKDMLLKYKKRS